MKECWWLPKIQLPSLKGAVHSAALLRAVYCLEPMLSLRGRTRGRQHAGRVAVGQEVAHVLAIGAAVVVVACLALLLVAHVQRVAAARGVHGDSVLHRVLLQSMLALKTRKVIRLSLGQQLLVQMHNSILGGHAPAPTSGKGCVRVSRRHLCRSRWCLWRSRRCLCRRRGAIAKDDLGCATRGSQHPAGWPVCQEVAHVLPFCKRTAPCIRLLHPYAWQNSNLAALLRTQQQLCTRSSAQRPGRSRLQKLGAKWRHKHVLAAAGRNEQAVNQRSAKTGSFNRGHRACLAGHNCCRRAPPRWGRTHCHPAHPEAAARCPHPSESCSQHIHTVTPGRT